MHTTGRLLPTGTIAILLILILCRGCVSAPRNGMSADGIAPSSSAGRPGGHSLLPKIDSPDYLTDAFRYGGTTAGNDTCRKPGSSSLPYFWGRLLTASMAVLKYDYITRLCLYSTGSEAHYKRGFLMDVLGFSDLATIEYTLAIEIDPENDRYYNNRGSIYLLEGRPYRAVIDLTRAIEINPGRPEAYYNRGRALETMGRYDEAREDYEKAVDLGICDKLPSLKICR